MNRITNAVNMSLGKLWEMVRDGGPGLLQSMGSQRVGHNWMNEQKQQKINTKTLNNTTGQF